MSLEEAIVAMTAALNRNSDLLEGLTSKAKAAQSAQTEAPVKAEKPAGEKPAPEKTEEAPKRTRAKAEKAEKVPSDAQMADATTKFLEVEDEDEFEARRDFVKKLLAKLGAKKMSMVEDGKRKGALEALEAFKNGEDTGIDGDDEEDLA